MMSFREGLSSRKFRSLWADPISYSESTLSSEGLSLIEKIFPVEKKLKQVLPKQIASSLNTLTKSKTKWQTRALTATIFQDGQEDWGTLHESGKQKTDLKEKFFQG